MPTQDFSEMFKQGGLAIAAPAVLGTAIVLAILFYAPLIYMTVLGKNPSAHERLIQLVEALKPHRDSIRRRK